MGDKDHRSGARRKVRTLTDLIRKGSALHPLKGVGPDSCVNKSLGGNARRA